MADPLSISAGVIGIIVPALHGSRLLLDDLRRIIDAPKALEMLKTHLGSVEMALHSLRAVNDVEWELLGDPVVKQSKAAIQSCTTACELFRTDLQRWTKHSDEKKLSWKDRTNVGFLKQRQIKSMSDQLQTCHIGINSVVGIATLYSSIRSGNITEQIKTSISARETEISTAISSTDTQLAAVETSLDEVRLDDAGEDRIQDAEDVATTVKQIEEERIALDLSRKLLEELLGRVRDEAAFKGASKIQTSSTYITFGNLDKGLQIGTNNAPISGIHF